MSEMGHHGIRRFEAELVGNRGPVDQDNWQGKRPRGVDLGAGRLAARVLGDDMGNAMMRQQRAIPGFGEGAAHRERDVIRQGNALGSLDEAQQIEVLGARGESIDRLPSDGQKNPCGQRRQGRHSPGGIRDLVPAVAGPGLPGRPFERDEAGAAARRSRHGVAAHARRERMRGIDEMRDLLGAKIIRQAFHPAEPANARRQGLGRWRLRASCVGENGVAAGLRQQLREAGGVRRAAKQQDFRMQDSGQRGACHG
ncbi:MAG: hypothetical protein FD175_2681 [Beijerinckiaceae bacterium]|nr:MAG: hypothetical protein FD175_2681 [Beijerinckiaceae bacterium]